jgi:hypothetical protein
MWSICCSVALSDMFTIMAMTFLLLPKTKAAILSRRWRNL